MQSDSLVCSGIAHRMLLLFQGVVERPLDAIRYQAWCPHGGANRTFGPKSIYQSSILSK